jgi:DNA-binding NarL/FixJ family response regulator
MVTMPYPTMAVSSKLVSLLFISANHLTLNSFSQLSQSFNQTRVTPLLADASLEYYLPSYISRSPDLILVDLAFPKLGINFVRRLRDRNFSGTVLINCDLHTLPDLEELAESGVDAVLPPIAGAIQLEHAISELKERQPGLLEYTYHQAGQTNSSSQKKSILSQKEKAVLRLAAYHLKDQAIAQELKMDYREVTNTLSRIYEKLGVTRRGEAIFDGITKGIISPHSLFNRD